jgi:hypothetical protein
MGAEFVEKIMNTFLTLFTSAQLETLLTVDVVGSRVVEKFLFILQVVFFVSDTLCLSSSSALHFFRIFFSGPPVNRDDRHLLAHAMASDFSAAWQCLLKRTIFFVMDQTPRPISLLFLKNGTGANPSILNSTTAL